MERPLFTSTRISAVFNLLNQKIAQRLNEKGNGVFISRHETQGIIDEEWMELLNACSKGTLREYEEELLDLAVACILGHASSAHFPETQ